MSDGKTSANYDAVIILTSLPSYPGGPRGVATKTIAPDGKGGLAITDVYKGTKWWSGHERTVNGISSLAELLEEVSRDTYAMIVRGRIAGGVDRARMRRRKTTRADGTGTIDESEHRWLLIDVDSLHADFDPVADPAATIAHVLARLPEAFRGVTCWYQFTSGAGIKPGIRIRLAFWLDRPLGTNDLKLWLGAKADKIRLYPIDLSVFVCTHPIYVASPIIGEGAWDPLGGRPRSGIVRGASDTVAVPPIEKPQYEPGSRASTRSDAPRSANFSEALSYIGDHDGGGGCHAALCRPSAGTSAVTAAKLMRRRSRWRSVRPSQRRSGTRRRATGQNTSRPKWAASSTASFVTSSNGNATMKHASSASAKQPRGAGPKRDCRSRRRKLHCAMR
jgi:hypothetical protein